MKNMKKLVALFAATTMAMSLSVSAFAASYADGTLTLEAADFLDTGAQKTMMAYVVAGTVAEDNIPAYDATAGHTMIALNQDADLTGNVLVDADAVTEGSTIVIKTSGSNGSVNTILLAQEVTPVTYNVTYVNVADTTGYPTTVNEGTTIKAFAESLTAPTKAADEDYTYAFAGWYTDADLTVPATSEEPVSTIAVEGVITLYAKYDATEIPQQPTTFTVAYVNAEGTTNAATVVEGTTIKAFIASLTAPTKAADDNYTYAFADWYKDADLTIVVDKTSEADVSTLAVEGTITLYAKYDATEIEKDDPVTIIVGDVDGDNAITGTDRDMLKAYCGAADKDAFNTANTMNIGVTVATDLVVGDVDGDNAITGTDRDMLKAYCGAADKDAFNTANSMIIGQQKSSK